jgi:Terminase RNaseH-like domain
MRAQDQPGSLGLVGAPTYPMLRDAAQRMFFELCPTSLIARHNKTENVTVMRNGSEILWRPAFEYDRYRGLNLAWFWLDEAPWCGYEAWQILKATLRQKVSAGYETAAWATGTPRGRDGYARDFELQPQANHALYRASTWANAHNLPDGFVADLGYTGAFAEQEIEGLFVAFEGLVYALDASEGSGNLNVWEKPLADLPRIIGGIDWGYTNPCALVVFGLDGDRRAWQLDEFYQRRASQEEVVLPALVKLTRQYGVQCWYADAADPEAIDRANNALAREGLQCRVRAVSKGPGSVRAGIQTVTSLLALREDGTRGLYIDPKCASTLAEYGSYAYATAERAKRDPSEEPVKQSDHALDATRYALFSELGQRTAVEAYLAEMNRLVKQPKPEQPEGYFR